MKFTNRFRIAMATIILLAGGSAHAAVNYATDTSNLTSIPSLTGFATTGSMMNGLSVTASFSNGLTQSRAWTTTAPGAGGVNGSGWALSLIGDSYGSYWNFSFSPVSAPLALTQLTLNGMTGYTVFDRLFDNNWGTDGSAQGTDLSFSDGAINANVTYSNQVAVNGQPPVGDLWHTVAVDFGNGIQNDFAFLQDTDNDSRFSNRIPEPATLGLLGLALAGLSFSSRRRASR